ncbi:MAG: hypothetical protein KME17_11565 [Cyanosarcina radialis HA8281-LM2]|jgi:hypothetical protein|nr:hypothetical protein [Cyanosarcina radialis HA8281-LM2]
MNPQQLQILTDLDLAARSTRKKAIEALCCCRNFKDKLAQYLLVWQCWQEVRTSLKTPINEYQLEHFQKVSDRYCSLTGEFLSAAAIECVLKNLGQAIRQLNSFQIER